jgi:hypothetical protein
MATVDRDELERFMSNWRCGDDGVTPWDPDYRGGDARGIASSSLAIASGGRGWFRAPRCPNVPAARSLVTRVRGPRHVDPGRYKKLERGPRRLPARGSPRIGPPLQSGDGRWKFRK